METKKLGELCSIVSGGTPSRSKEDYWQNGTIPWIKIGNIKGKYIDEADEYITIDGLSNSSAKMLSKGTILYTIFATLGEVGILNFDACTNQAIAGLTVLDEKKVSVDYLYYYLKSKKEYVNNIGRGVAQNNINMSILRSFEVPVPSFSEQAEIVSILDKAKSIIDMRQQQLQSLNDLIKARFVEISNSNKSSNLLSEFITPFSAQRCGERDLPVLSITKADGIVFQDAKFKKRIASTDASTYKVIPRGKLVQGIHIDERNFAIQNITDEGIVSPAYKVWSVNDNKAIPEVLAYALRSDYAMAYISSKFTGSVKRRESISNNDFLAMPINLPPIEAQKTIYMFMQQIDKSKFVVQQALDKAQLLFDSLMQEYFG